MRLRKGVIKSHGSLIIIFLIGLCVFQSLLFAGEVNSLREIYDTPIPAEIRRNFNEYLQDRVCEHGVVDGEKFIDIYGKKFLVISVAPNSFGGVWAIIAVEGETKHAYLLWLYDIDDKVYDLRLVDTIRGNFDKQFVQEFHSPAYSKFWM